MAINIDWGQVLSTAGPALATMAQGKTTNRAADNTTAITQARDAELAAQARARAAVEAGTLDVARQREAREGAAQAVRDAQIGALMKNMQDVKFADVSGFRSKVPELHFSGGSRPSAFGAEGKQLADVMGNRAMQTLMTPQGGGGGGGGGGGQAVGRNQGVMPDYQPAEQKAGGFWENALGIAGLGATIGGAMIPKAAGAGTPSVAANVAKNPKLPQSGWGSLAPPAGGGAASAPAIAAGAGQDAAQIFAGGIPGSTASLLAGTPGMSAAQLFGSSTAAPSLISGTPGASFAQLSQGVKGVPGAATAGATGAKGGSNALMRILGSSSGGATGAMGALNAAAGPAGMVAGLVSPYLPAGKAREMANYASKGAMIGSFFPGAGTAIGAGIGAGVGAVKGHQNETVGDRKDLAKRLGYGNLDLLYKALEGMGPEGMKLRQQGLNVIGKHDVKGNELWKQQVTNLLGRR